MIGRTTTVIVLSATLVAACGGGHATKASNVSASKQTWVERAPEPTPPIPVAEAHATAGEHMAYKLSLQGLEVASFTVDVGEPTQVEQTKVLPIETRARSAGVAKLVKNVDYRFTSWIDPTTSRPLRFAAAETASAHDANFEQVRWDIFARSDAGYPVVVERADAGTLDERQLGVQGELWDFNAFLIALRGYTPVPGTQITVDVARSRFMWRTQITAAPATEQIVTSLGELPAMRFDGVARQVERDGAFATDETERHFSIWVSDDADRVPIVLVARTDYGDIRMEIVEYTPGR